MTTHKVTLSDGANLYVKVLGDISSSNPLLIALHSAPGLSTHTEPEAAFGFLQSQFTIIVYDARGSGISDLTPPYTNERWANDVDELREWAGAEKFVLAGGSYGGMVSLDYALLFPNRLSALILRGAWAWGTRGMMDALKNSLTSDRITVDADRQMRMWCGILHDDEDFLAAITEMSPLFAAEGGDLTEQESKPAAEDSDIPIAHAATHNFAFSYNMPKFDVRSRLKEILVPTLVIVGRHDLVTPVYCSEEIASGIPNSQLVIFEKSGHNPGSEEPALFRTVVEGFCQKVLKGVSK